MPVREGQFQSLDMHTSIPWIFALVAGLWFVFMAYRARQGWIGWGIAGAVLGLFTTTIIMGLGHAAHIAYSSEDAQAFRAKTAFLSALATLILGWLFTMGLHRHHLLIWRTVKKLSGKG